MKNYAQLINEATRLVNEFIPLAVDTGKVNEGVAKVWIATLNIYINMSEDAKQNAHASFDHLITTIVRSI